MDYWHITKVWKKPALSIFSTSTLETEAAEFSETIVTIY